MGGLYVRESANLWKLASLPWINEWVDKGLSV